MKLSCCLNLLKINYKIIIFHKTNIHFNKYNNTKKITIVNKKIIIKILQNCNKMQKIMKI